MTLAHTHPILNLNCFSQLRMTYTGTPENSSGTHGFPMKNAPFVQGVLQGTLHDKCCSVDGFRPLRLGAGVASTWRNWGVPMYGNNHLWEYIRLIG